MKERWHWALVIVVCVALGVAAKSSTDPTPTMAQDTVVLDRRLNMLEQRFYSMESRMSRLEQQMSMLQRVVPAPTPTPTPNQTQPMRDPVTDLLRNEVELMKVRVGELECGILRLDERTLSAATKEARRRAGAQPKDPCRLNVEAPVKLSVRP